MNRKIKKALKKPISNKIEIHVAPRNGKAARQVVAKWCDGTFVDEVNTEKAAAREKFVARLAIKMNLDNSDPTLVTVEDDLVEEAEKADAIAETAAKKGTQPEVDETAKALKETPTDVLELAKAFLSNPDLLEELADDFQKLGIAGEKELATIEYIIGTSRLLPKPLGGSVKSASSSGKSYVTEMVTSLFPPEVVITATDITPSALYYCQEGKLKNKLIVVGERRHTGSSDDAIAANATLALREMLSRGRLDKMVPMKTEGGEIRTQHIRQEGPIAYLETTTQQQIFEEDATRLLALATDESPQQTAAILEMQARQAAWKTASPQEQDAVRQKHQTAQRLLKKVKVRIKFAEHLKIPPISLAARRAYPQLLGCIEAVALLRQMTKTIREDGSVDARSSDYAIAYELMMPILRRTFAPLSERAVKLLGVIQVNAGTGKTFDRGDCAKWAGVGLTEVRHRLDSLIEAGCVEQLAGGKGVRYTYKFVSGKVVKTPGLSNLITPYALWEAITKPKKKSSAPEKASGKRKAFR